MTTPTAAKNAPAKSAPNKVDDNKSAVAKVADVKQDEVKTETPVETPVERIPDALAANPILADFCRQYLSVVDDIAKYNKAVLAEKTSDWTAGKVLEKAREFARPTDANVKPNDKVKTALDAYDDAVNKLAHARKAVLDVTSGELGINLSVTAERNPEIEAPMRERRKFATEIATQLGMIAKITNDTNASNAVSEFLEKNGLPAIGRDQVRTFGDSDKATTPKYRVHIVVTDADGNVKVSEDGFTKTSLALAKFYPRGEGIKTDTLRTVWEKAGNSSDNTVQPTVEFNDNDLHFVITKK